MNHHLSQDQLSMWIIGRSTPEEQRHGRECPQCRAELERFQQPVSTFRVAMQDWSDGESVPRLSEVSTFLSRPRRIQGPAWSAAVLATLILVAIPIFRQETRAPETDAPTAAPIQTKEMEDALLMEAVFGHLSRTVPRPMQPLMAVVPDDESTMQSEEMR